MNITEQQLKRLLEAYLNGTASPAEKELLDNFFSSYPQTYQQAMSDNEEVRQQIWEELSERLQGRTIATPVRSMTPWYSAAAVFALFITMFYFLVYKKDTAAEREHVAVLERHAVTERGQKLKVELVDGTQVTLNANSKLTFPEQFTGSTREVTLEGEGYFEVAPNPAQPFIVHTQVAQTKVLGTVFNVKSETGGSTEITLVEGKVDVSPSNNNAQHVILAPNQQAVVSNSQAIATHRLDDVTAYTDWKDNILHFEDITLKEAAALLEAWYNVNVTFENASLQECRITATYRKETLKNILASLEYTMKISSEQQGSQVLLKGKCN